MIRSATASRYLVGAAVLAAVWIRVGAIPDDLLAGDLPSTVVVDRHGTVLYEARSSDGTRATPVSADALPDAVVRATLAAEDSRFYRHVGVDPLALARAAARNLLALRRVEGGSTITQQTAKLLLGRQRIRDGAPSGARTWTLKLRETILALRLEHRFTKPQILALYLNLAPYGNEIVGIGRASRAYFGCAPSLLTPAQAAFLAALPQRPSEFDPYRQPGAAVARTRFVIGRMEALGWLSAAQAQEARAERLVIAPRERPWLAPHFVQMVLAGATPARTSRIETTLDAALQRDVEGIVRAARPGLERHRAHNIAVVVLDNETGGWLAWEGSGDYFDAAHGGAIDGVTTPRQPGSALKPFTYALAFDRGFSPATVLPDLPSHFPTADPGVVYVPRNYDGRYRGPLRARLALAGSENVPAVAVVSDVGVPTLVRLLRRAGLTTFEKTAAYYGLGATLGDGEVTLAELVSAYAALARGGEWQRPHYLAADARRDPVRVVSERAAFWVSDILCDNDAREFVFGRGGALEFDVPVAVKTGTSQGYHDNWTIGFTRAVTVGVWVGNFDRTPLVDSSGVTGAAPIFHAVMLAARARVSSSATLATAPPNVTRARICALSGMRANRWCPSQISEWLPVENPPLPCSWHHLSDGEVVVVWPAEYREWARRHSADPEPEMPRAAAAAASAPSARQTTERFAIVSPPPGAIYLMDPTLRRSFQSLPLRAIGGQGAVDWQVDGKSVGIAADHRPLMWPLAVGVHHLAARDAAGRTADVEIVVK